MDSLVTVIIPCFNHGVYIHRTLHAIWNQTWKNLEVIIVDDGSDEETRKILQVIEKTNVKVLFQENGKTSKARNTGFANAAGKYILTIDADDLLEPTFVEKGMEVLRQHPKIGVVSAWVNCFGFSNYQWLPTGGGVEDFLEDINCSAFGLIRREIWEANGGFDESMQVGYEDWEFWLNTTKKGWVIHIIPEFLLHYRIKWGSRAFDAFNSRKEIVNYIKQKHRDLY